MKGSGSGRVGPRHVQMRERSGKRGGFQVDIFKWGFVSFFEAGHLSGDVPGAFGSI